jgi:lipoyl(octanoyl) transferase
MTRIKNFFCEDYLNTWQEMKTFTDNRNSETEDELWIGEHPPVFTLGLAGLQEHILEHSHGIPIVRTDRGGQVTYHAPGQIIIYCLLDLQRLKLSIRELVEKLELGIINFLAYYKIEAHGNRKAPGVYVNNQKIASLGLKVRKGCTYHGLSFNYNMNLAPFEYINVCGYKGLEVTQFVDLVKNTNIAKLVNNHELDELIKQQLAQNVLDAITCNQ